jgi:2-keto-4-pentenoate hydratase
MDTQAIAEQLLREHAAGTAFTPFAAAGGIATLDAAYAVQDAFVSLLRERRGAAPAGYKIGLTSPRMQAMCGIDTPVAGVVLADGVHDSGATLRRDAHAHFGIEFEIAVRMAADLVPGDSLDLDAVACAVDAVCPAIEVVDDRHCDYRALDVLSLVADNAWNAGIVLGRFVHDWPDLAGVAAAVHVDGAADALDSGSGSAVLGHPFAALDWLSRHLTARGERLRAGDIVMTGSIVTTKFPAAPGLWRYTVEGLGDVTLHVA